jgi:PAS domain S-box-containing protein
MLGLLEGCEMDAGPQSSRLARENRLLRIYATVSRMVAQHRDPALIRDEACRLLVAQGGFALAWIGLCEADGSIAIAAQSGEQEAYARGLQLRWDDTPLGRGPSGIAARENRTCVAPDLLAHTGFHLWSVRAASFGLLASISTPLRAEGRVLGVLTVYAGDRGPFDPGLVRVLEEVAELLGFALQAADGERARREAEEQLQAFFASDALGVFFSSAGAGVRRANDRFLAMVGYTRAELDAGLLRWEGLTPPEHLAVDQARFEEAQARGACTPYEKEFLRKDGRRVWVIVSYVLIGARRDEGLALVLEIDAQKQAERALRASEQALRASEALARTAFNGSPDIMTMTDLTSGAYVAVNDAFVRASGYTREEAIGQTSASLGVWARPEDRTKLIELLAQSPHVEGFEAPLLVRDGRQLLASISADRVSYLGRDCVVISLRDVTEMRRLEAERSRLLAAFAQMSEVLIVTDIEANIAHVNPAFERVTGWSRAEVLGQNARLLRSGQHDEAFYAGLWAVISRGEVFRGTFINKRKDGQLYRADVAISPVRDAAGVITHYVAVQRDTTQEHALRGQLLQSQKMEVVGRIAGGVAHDFNNILTAILTSTHFLLEDLPGDDPRRDDALVVAESAERAAALTRQLLTFSRQEIAQPRVLDLNAIVHNLSKMLRRLLREDLQFTVGTTADDIAVCVDACQLEQVVMNLVVNARDAISGGGSITLRTLRCAPAAGDARAPHGRALLEVQDSGCGMSRTTLAQIFEPFFTTKERGTGLGLATVLSIVDGWKGAIEVESEPGRGSLFRVSLPLSKVSPVEAGSRQSALVAPRALTILLVEDDAAVRALLARTLQLHGYTVLVAASVESGLSRAEPLDQTIDALVTDLILADGNGYAMGRQIAARRPEMRTLLISGYSDDAAAARGIHESDVGFLLKPFTPPELLRALQALLAGEPGG